MIRLLRRLGRFPKGTETDYFDAAAEAAFLLDGTAEPVGKPQESGTPAQVPAKTSGNGPEKPDYRAMKKDDLLREAMARGLEVPPRAKVAEIIAALEGENGDSDA
ncbi:MAG: hypothetical protein IJ087_01665 [Eggerthellaceae bacterium]|nr:hypothetical protein [Eggerthellaceae bacterium]